MSEREAKGNTVTEWNIWIDTGGTFTDCLATGPDGMMRRVKVLSSSSLRGVVAEQTATDVLRVQADWLPSAQIVGGFDLSPGRFSGSFPSRRSVTKNLVYCS